MGTRSAALASVVLAAALSGCAEPGRPSSEVTTAFEHRALEVDEAWRSLLRSQGVQAWRNGIVPLEDLTIPPAEGLDSKTSFAFAQGWYHASVPLPSSQPGPGTVTFPDGATATVALDSASAVYGRIDKGDPPCRAGSVTPPQSGSPSPDADGVTGAPAESVCAVLTVTGATLGTTTLRTSRGAATVPAWLFSVAGLPAPIARVALRPTELSPMPNPVIEPMGAGSEGLVSAIRLTAAQDQTVSFTIGVGACSRNPEGLVYETSEAIVVAGRVENSQGPCVASMALQPVTVTLISPIGDRIVLNAFDGQPMAVDRSGPG